MARNSIRRSQAVVPFGVGAIVEFPNQSLMAAGLDAWPPEPKCAIYDARLARRLGVQEFREPPPAPRPGQAGKPLPFVRFPLWHFCPRCRAISRTTWNASAPPRCSSDLLPRTGAQPCSKLPEKRRWRMVPVRFVTVCAHGHVDEFPWEQWAHSKGTDLAAAVPCAAPKLRLNYTGKAGLLGLIVKCEACGKTRSMIGSAGEKGLAGIKCTGNRPWLGPKGKQDGCAATPRAVIRGATNLYFSKVASSILIPPYTTPIRKLIDDPHYWSVLTSGVQAGGQLEEARVKMFADMHSLNLNELKAAIQQKLTGDGGAGIGAVGEEEYRFDEYQALLAGKTKPEDDLFLRPQSLDLYDSEVTQYFSSIVLVEKLAETRALTGFARLNPPPMREFDKKDQQQLSLQPVSWLPAIRVYGEGIFLTLNQARLDAWTQQAAGRIDRMVRNHERVCRELGRRARTLSPAFVLLHTLAHLLIRRLSFECGYGSSSVRERIYSRQEGPHRMAGVLLYTAAGDCEGTLGGLVRQGKPQRLEAIVRGALEDARWCGSDPLCAESAGQGTDSVNLAACHACALLPETSCEEGNRFLDRVLLIGTLKEPKLAFFRELVEGINLGVTTANP